ncbi:meiosis protein MEI2 [Aspergillus campestris IBT 28561]|uniref:Meiosis protein MEI2 n=1 Tax=Aspergillus campestris (strain IBT 28561) TaxID=1392248 RepID=A0A2I1DAK7_ASPC2|nr:meiosis protein MEI2 [Aspergillus campestris IBT 28561]PKY06900.1 meiosis protein MEI2 [Aspergillus campestris IBT 28561]
MRANGSPLGLSSPCSTNEVVSPNGSPDTKITAFSPEDIRARGRPESGICTSSNDPGFRKLYSVASTDPFLVPACVKLSPTAATFTPSGTASLVLSSSQARGVGHLLAKTPPESTETGTSPPEYLEDEPSRYRPVGRFQPKNTSLSYGFNFDKVDGERRSRAMVIENVPTNLTYILLAGFFNRREFTTVKGPVLTDLRSMGKVYVAFTDSRETRRAIEKVHLLRPEWRISPLTIREYVQHTEPSNASQASDYEGQLLVTVYYDGRNPSLNKCTVARSLEALFMTFGDIKEFTNLPTGQENISEFHAEFFNTRDGENVISTLNGSSVDDCVLDISLFRPDVEDRAPVPHPSPCPATDSFPHEDPFLKNMHWVSNQNIRGPYMELSPTGRSTVPPGEHAGLLEWMSRAGEKILASPRRELSRYADLRVSNQNAVDIERIRLGLDVRTTIMLRNIPNKIDQTMLKAIVDETSHGKYDFMYLRIDFANNCNVGYAFINFEDPIDIIDFVNARAGNTWNCFNSDKVAEVSYATIQGKDCLVQKFRNSSVMLEHPSFRPKIFHTGIGGLAGTEDRFPGPDNPSKMRRSIENAEHVGLFAPRVGQQYRDEQRRRRSQFDRGTTAAEREVVYVRTLAPRAPSPSRNALKSAPCTYPAMKVWYGSAVPERGPRTS